VEVRREVRQHLLEPGLHLREATVDAPADPVVDVGVGGEHPVEVVEALLVDRRRVVDQQLLNLEAVGDLVEGHHGLHQTAGR